MRTKEEIFSLYAITNSDELREHMERLFVYKFDFPDWQCEIGYPGKCKICGSFSSSKALTNQLCNKKCDINTIYKRLISINQDNPPSSLKIGFLEYYKGKCSSVSYYADDDCKIREDVHSAVKFVPHDFNFDLVAWWYHQPNNYDLHRKIKNIRANGLSTDIILIYSSDDEDIEYNSFMYNILDWFYLKYKEIMNEEQKKHSQSIKSITSKIDLIKNLQKKYEVANKNERCAICQNKQKTHSPECGHFIYCGDCINKITKCAMCKARIVKKIKIFT